MHKHVKFFLIFCLMLSSHLESEEMVIDSPKEITLEWETKVLGIKQTITDLADAVEELTAGITTPYFGKDFLATIKETIKKQPTGEYIEYWPNGKMKAKLGYKNGKAHGHIHGWYENGKDAFKGFYDEGVKQGIHIAFFHSDTRLLPLYGCIRTYNEEGRLQGEQWMEHRTGDLWVCINYKNGVVDGPFECWDVKGKQFISANYKNGKLQNGPPPPPGERGKPTRPYTKPVDEVIKTFIREAQKEFPVRAYGTGGDMPHDVETISIDFIVYKKGTVEEARELMVKLTEKFAAMINSHEALIPYLREYPIAPRRAAVSVAFRQSDNDTYKDGSIVLIFMGKDDRLLYFAESAQTEERFQAKIEPYETAVKIVKATAK